MIGSVGMVMRESVLDSAAIQRDRQRLLASRGLSQGSISLR